MPRYSYQIRLHEPTEGRLDGEAITLDRDVWGLFTATTAIEYARRCGNRNAGTTIRIERARRSTNRRYKVTGDWMPYRAYVVSAGGIVRRTDR